MVLPILWQGDLVSVAHFSVTASNIFKVMVIHLSQPYVAGTYACLSLSLSLSSPCALCRPDHRYCISIRT
jgi:hypothetical protein